MDKKKAVIIVGLVVVFVVALGAGLWSRGTADRVQEKLDLAVKYISENDFDKAILAYNDAIKIDSKQVKAYQGLARVYTLQGKYDEAKAVYDRGLGAVLASDQNTIRLGLAGMYFDQGQLADAEKAFQEIIKGTQNCMEAYWGLAMVYQKQGDNVKAETILRQAVAKYPNDYRGYNTLALFLKQNDKGEDALKNLVKSLSIEINQQEAYIVLSDLYKGNWGVLQSNLSTISNQPVAAMLEFYMNYSSGDNARALNTYNSKLSAQTSNYKAQILAAIVMIKSGDKTGAQNLINQVQNQKFNDWLLSDLALYYQVAGNNDQARLCAIKAIQANGTNLEAVALLQKLNTGEEKKYTAEFLLYNWAPVQITREEIQSKALPVPGFTPALETNTKLTSDYVVPKPNVQYTFKVQNDCVYYKEIVNRPDEHSTHELSETWTRVTDKQFRKTVKDSEGTTGYQYDIDENYISGVNLKIKFASPGESWHEQVYDEEVKSTYDLNYTFDRYVPITVLGQTTQAAHIICSWGIKQSDLSGTEESWYVKGMGLVKQIDKSAGDTSETTSTKELVSTTPIVQSNSTSMTAEDAVDIVKRFRQDTEKESILDYSYDARDKDANYFSVNLYMGYRNGNYYMLAAEYLVDKKNGTVKRLS